MRIDAWYSESTEGNIIEFFPDVTNLERLSMLNTFHDFDALKDSFASL